MLKNAIYAQSGGVTSVINATAASVILTARQYQDKINKIYAGFNGILGILNEEIIDTSFESEETIKALRYTPGGAFGSCRYKLKNFKNDRSEYERLIEVFKAHNIEYFFYNGGNDSADTCLKVSQIAQELNYPIKAIHLPKTIDNDLVITDNCPGFGSVAKYIATSTMEAGFDLQSMCRTSTQVFILEVMGRNAGWIAASSGLASTNSQLPPHIILFPEIIFNEESFLQQVVRVVNQYGYCVIVASEGIKTADKQLLSMSNNKDAFGHIQLGGVASKLSQIIALKLKYKVHYAIADYLQRSARHLASLVDVMQAIKIGEAGVKLAIDGFNAVMPYISRDSEAPYSYSIKHAKIEDVANKEKLMPLNFITPDGYHITDLCRQYISPLIFGEDYPEFLQGLPNYVRLKNILINKKLQNFINYGK